MSDFIKVTFKNNGRYAVVKKSNIELVKEGGINEDVGNFYCFTFVSRLEEMIFCSAILGSSYYDVCKRAEITREEYDRLCKELGVE